jgi:hypothetical protein
MTVNLKSGIDKLLFGMKQNDVIAIYGQPDKQYKDEDDNVIFAYNSQKMRLTFYQEEAFRLGYIVASHQDFEVLGKKLLAKTVLRLKNNWLKKG